MRDLYQRLGIGFGADAKNIKRAAARCADADVVQSATQILLVSHRRRAYDQVYVAARHVAALRSALALESAAWAIEYESDFHGESLPGTPDRNRPAPLDSEHKQPQDVATNRPRSFWQRLFFWR